MKKLICLLGVCLSLLSVNAGTVILDWDDTTNQVSTTYYKIYRLSGTNATFTVGNTNIVLSAVTTNNGVTSVAITNLNAGTWSFVATANSTVSGLESPYSNVAWTNIYNVPSVPTFLRIISVQSP